MQIRNEFLERCLIFLAVFIGLALITSPALAQETVDVGVTQAMEEVINAITPVGETLPLNMGEMSARFENVSADVNYSFPDAQVDETVDTGWDMSDITDTTSATVGPEEFFDDTATISAGDSVVRAVEIANLSNNYVDIDYDAIHEFAEASDSFTLELWYEDGSHTAGEFDAGTATEVDGGAGAVPGWTMGEVKTLFLVVEAESFAGEGDEVKSDFLVTNNAPPETETGDGWERGEPVAEDTYDTQTGVFWTEVAGPVITLSKSQTVNDARPGGTIDYTITVENTGSDTAYELEVVDAIPEFATFEGSYSSGMADSVEAVTELGDEDWADIETVTDEEIAKIRWYYEEFSSEEDGDHIDTVDFTIVID